MADANIGSLPAVESLDDDSLLVVEQQGAVGKVTGAQLKALARVGVDEYVAAAQTAAQNALEAAQQAKDAVASVQGAAEQAAAAEAANEAAQAAMQAAEAAQKAAEAAAELAKQQAADAAETAATDAVANVDAALAEYVAATKAAQADAEAARDQAQAIAGGDFLSLAGGTLTGPLVLAGEPTADSQAATKKYVDNAKEIFIATYGETTYAEITEAYNAGKTVFAKATIITLPWIMPMVSPNLSGPTYFCVFNPLSGVVAAVSCGTDDTWTTKLIPLQPTADKVTAISADSTNNQYPTAKAVYDAIQTAISDSWEASY